MTAISENSLLHTAFTPRTLSEWIEVNTGFTIEHCTKIRLVVVLTKSAPASILSYLLHEEEREIFAKLYLV